VPKGRLEFYIPDRKRSEGNKIKMDRFGVHLSTQMYEVVNSVYFGDRSAPVYLWSE